MNRRDYRGKENPNYRGGRYVPCAHCGKEVYRMPCQLKVKNTFCGPHCHDEYRRKPKEEKPPQQGVNHWRWSGPKQCKSCGTELNGYAPRRRGYCSDSCATQGKSAARKRATQGSANPNWRGGPITLSCAFCGTDFAVPFSRATTAQYCSTECSHMAQRNRSAHICEHCGKSFEVPESREKNQEERGTPVRFCSVACKLSFGGRTSLEIAVADALKEAGFDFEEQYQLQGKRWLYDFYLPKLDLLIEADGDFYHHSDWALEQGQGERDRQKTQYAQSLGFRFLRIREGDLRKVGANDIISTLVWPIKIECVALSQLA